MPKGDRKGPTGMGSMTGRAAGFCAGFGRPGYANSAPGRGFGTGMGRGRCNWPAGFGYGHGRRNMARTAGFPAWMRFGGDTAPNEIPAAYPALDPEMEKQALMRQADALQSELDAIKARMSRMETEPAKE